MSSSRLISSPTSSPSSTIPMFDSTLPPPLLQPLHPQNSRNFDSSLSSSPSSLYMQNHTTSVTHPHPHTLQRQAPVNFDYYHTWSASSLHQPSHVSNVGGQSPQLKQEVVINSNSASSPPPVNNFSSTRLKPASGSTSVSTPRPSAPPPPILPAAWLDTQSQNHQPSAANALLLDDELIPTAVVIKNIPFAVKKEQLVQVMTDMQLPLPYAFNYHFDNGVFRGLAFANFSTPQETALVIDALNHFELHGRKLRVEYKKLLPVAERERIEREKRERRGQLEEQHRPHLAAAAAAAAAAVAAQRHHHHQQSLRAQSSRSSLASSCVTGGSYPSPLPSQSVRNAKLDLDCDMNDPTVLKFYSQLLLFKEDLTHETMSFSANLSPGERRIVHVLAHFMGLGHISRGQGDKRYVHIYRLPHTSSYSTTSTSSSSHSISVPSIASSSVSSSSTITMSGGLSSIPPASSNSSISSSSNTTPNITCGGGEEISINVCSTTANGDNALKPPTNSLRITRNTCSGNEAKFPGDGFTFVNDTNDLNESMIYATGSGSASTSTTLTPASLNIGIKSSCISTSSTPPAPSLQLPGSHHGESCRDVYSQVLSSSSNCCGGGNHPYYFSTSSPSKCDDGISSCTNLDESLKSATFSPWKSNSHLQLDQSHDMILPINPGKLALSILGNSSNSSPFSHPLRSAKSYVDLRSYTPYFQSISTKSSSLLKPCTIIRPCGTSSPLASPSPVSRSVNSSTESTLPSNLRYSSVEIPTLSNLHLSSSHSTGFPNSHLTPPPLSTSSFNSLPPWSTNLRHSRSSGFDARNS